MKRATVAARLALLAAGLTVLGGIAQPDASDDMALATRIAEGLTAACPPADPGDEKARDLCAEKLTQFKVLRDTLSDPIYWGGHRAGASYAPEDSQLTLFNPFVWRRMYLSLFMFPGPYRIERADPFTVLH